MSVKYDCVARAAAGYAEAEASALDNVKDRCLRSAAAWDAMAAQALHIETLRAERLAKSGEALA